MNFQDGLAFGMQFHHIVVPVEVYGLDDFYERPDVVSYIFCPDDVSVLFECRYLVLSILVRSSHRNEQVPFAIGDVGQFFYEEIRLVMIIYMEMDKYPLHPVFLMVT